MEKTHLVPLQITQCLSENHPEPVPINTTASKPQQTVMNQAVYGRRFGILSFTTI
ncbi:conjugal transfer protein [Neisseria wadsworthii 9715]|uniref:Conjugal transfer protein n=1 Tax=Neisseria wadsworthii 9715 TaxID=1030841 RepID=G4CSZ0_9NEIS|nr:conjugal transfer protein [Neisseria wadsworthii 9715]